MERGAKFSRVCDECGADVYQRGEVSLSLEDRYMGSGGTITWRDIPHSCILELRRRLEKLEANCVQY